MVETGNTSATVVRGALEDTSESKLHKVPAKYHSLGFAESVWTRQDPDICFLTHSSLLILFTGLICEYRFCDLQQDFKASFDLTPEKVV